MNTKQKQLEFDCGPDDLIAYKGQEISDRIDGLKERLRFGTGIFGTLRRWLYYGRLRVFGDCDRRLILRVPVACGFRERFTVVSEFPKKEVERLVRLEGAIVESDEAMMMRWLRIDDKAAGRLIAWACKKRINIIKSPWHAQRAWRRMAWEYGWRYHI